MNYLRTRITQPTTWIGVAAAAAAVSMNGGQITPDIISNLLIAFGLVHVNEKRVG